MKKETRIIKVNLSEPFDVSGVSVDFEEFEDLFLYSLENKTKVKPRKRKELFDFVMFNHKEKARLQKRYEEKSQNASILSIKNGMSVSVSSPIIYKSPNQKSIRGSPIRVVRESPAPIRGSPQYSPLSPTQSFVKQSLFSRPAADEDEYDDFEVKTAISHNNVISAGTSAASTPIVIKRTVSHVKPNKDSFKSDIIKSSSRKKSFASTTSSAAGLFEDDEKRELLFKFQILAKKNPELVSKYQFNMRSDLRVMKNTYALILKQISSSNRVDNLNTYLLAVFMGCEYFFGKMGFDMEGFSKQQISSMSSYESLLQELGEKEYTPYGMDKWSVEVRLAMTIMFNTLWFIVAKSISKKTNFDILSLLSITKKETAPATQTYQPVSSGSAPRMMKGPDV
ncbi:hypothetical protein AV955_gp064 [Diadromus pulchellus ascovirus 4a]|uniref:Complete DpAV4 genome n=1 Tax=Diadromus pulchellus ascovirus 4a TaxID=158683 RepID=F2NYZ3_9VIRU|nr:hypothetical protein AV955_gp064 [Diadromus pulchellus ascovirus 4a]CCA61421.1 unnamed protein product [Diadromus pulchellus ascovirus 4a]